MKKVKLEMNQRTHAVVRTHTYARQGRRVQVRRYLSSGTMSDCDALVSTYATHRALFGDSLDESEICPPSESIIPVTEIPKASLERVFGRSAATITRHLQDSLNRWRIELKVIVEKAKQEETSGSLRRSMA